jgi:hypothetical protein
MKALRITTSAGVQKLISTSKVFEVEVTNNFITKYVIEDTDGEIASVTVAAYTGSNDRVELGCLVPGNIFTAYVANYPTK